MKPSHTDAISASDAYTQKNPGRYATYIMAGIAAVVLFCATYGIHYLWWFSNDLVAAAGNRFIDNIVEARKAKAVPVEDSASLAEAIKNHSDTEQALFSFLASHEFSYGEKVYVEIFFSDWENPELTPAQASAFDSLLLNYPRMKEALLSDAVDNYSKQREELLQGMQKQGGGQKDFDVYFPEITREEVENQTETWFTLTNGEKRGMAYVMVNFHAAGKRTVSLTSYLHDVSIASQEDYFESFAD